MEAGRLHHLRTYNHFKRSKELNANRVSKKTIIFFKILHVLHFLDLGFIRFKSYKLKVFFKSISLFLCYTSCITVLYNVLSQEPDLQMRLWYGIYTFHHMFYVTYFATISEKRITFKKFYDELLSIDSRLMVVKSYRFEIKFFIINLIPLLYSIVLDIICTMSSGDYACFHPVYATIYYTYIASSVNLVLILNGFIFYLTYCRLVTYKNAFVEKKLDLYFSQHLYKSLVDLAENIKRTFDPVVR